MAKNELESMNELLEMMLKHVAMFSNLREAKKHGDVEKARELDKRIGDYAFEVTEKGAVAMTVLHSMNNSRLNAAFSVVMERYKAVIDAVELLDWGTVQGDHQLAVSTMLAELRRVE